MPAKRNLGPATDRPETKVQRADTLEPGADFSAPVKEKLLKSQRTGQACDRCKVRKIRCDGRPGGCSPCLQNNTECRTTDRITGRATSRGYIEGLEHEVHSLRQNVRDLQRQLHDAGIEAKPGSLDGYVPAGTTSSGLNWASPSTTERPLWEAEQALSNAQPYSGSIAESTDSRGSEPSTYRASLPTLRTGLVGDNYLGVSSANSNLSSFHGTTLSVFGMEINLNDFIPPDTDDSTSALSYSEFLSCANRPRPEYDHVPLPSHSDCKEYAIWFLKSINPFMPILHKPGFMRLIDRVYNEGYEPTAAEDVMIHMMLATLKFQYASRNSDQLALEASNLHYRHSLGRFHDLGQGHSIEDAQAVTMICLHMRNFPKPGAAWVVATLALSIALEMGLHRSAKAWSQGNPKPNILQGEMKKRVFWSVLMIVVNLGGKLGRPMPLRIEDIDVEYPEPINDNLPGEPPNCSFVQGIQSYRIASVYLQMYGTLYAIKAPARSYEPTVRKLERELKDVCDQIPSELCDPEQAVNENIVFAHFLKLWENEIDLSVHHPALCRSSSKEFMSNNLDHCLRATSALVHHAYQLLQMRSLDTTWIAVTTFVAAIFTTLFAWRERANRMNNEDLIKLRKDMAQWIEIIGYSGVFIGSGRQLQEALRPIIDTSLASFEQTVTAKTASTVSVQLTTDSSQDTKQPPELYDSTQPYGTSYSNVQTSNNIPQTPDVDIYQSSIPTNPSPLDQQPNTYPSGTATQYTYPEPSSAPIAASYPSNPASSFESTPYPLSAIPSESDIAHATRVANAAANATSSHAHGTTSHLHRPSPRLAPSNSAFQVFQQHPYHQQQPSSTSQVSQLGSNQPNVHGAPTAWRQFTEGVLGNYDPSRSTHAIPDTNYHQMSAAALMELQGGAGGRDHSGGIPSAGDTGTRQVISPDGQGMAIPGQQQQIWPLMTYHMGHGGG